MDAEGGQGHGRRHGCSKEGGIGGGEIAAEGMSVADGKGGGHEHVGGLGRGLDGGYGASERARQQRGRQRDEGGKIIFFKINRER